MSARKTSHLLIHLTLVIIMCLGCSNISTQNESTEITNKSEFSEYDSCIKSFDSFAYNYPRNSEEMIEPLSPWRSITELPEAKNPIPRSQVVLGRSTGDRTEIWIRAQGYPLLSPSTDTLQEFWVFLPDSNQWETVSTIVEGSNSNVNVGKLFTSSDGSIWGQNILSARVSSYVDTPLLSKFNEKTRKFQFVSDSVEFPLKIPGSVSLITNGVAIFLAKDDTFWFFVFDDGIYRFIPSSGLTERYAELPDIEVIRVVETPGGEFFLTGITGLGYERRSNIIYKYFPSSNQLIAMHPPFDSWPEFSGIVLDANGILWLDSIGYISPGNKWNLLLPDIKYYLENIDKMAPIWSPPTILMESNDGRLWYINFSDSTFKYEGLAWFNPSTNKGCQFTNIATNIIQFSDSMWLVANGKLFSYDLQ